MEVKSKKNSFLMGTLILGAAGVIIKILGAIFRIPLGYFIGADGMGYYQTAYPVYALFLTLATAGFPTAIAKLVSEEVSLENHKGANEIFRITHIMLFITGAIMFLVLYFGAEQIVSRQHNPNAISAMKAIAPALLIVPSMSAYRGYYQGYQQMSRIAISQIIEQVFRVCLGLSLAYILMAQFKTPRLGAAGGISGATIGAFASFLFLFTMYFMDRRERHILIENSKNYEQKSTWKIIKRILLVVIPISVGACIMPLVNVIDTVLIISRLEVAGFSNIVANKMFGQLTGMAMSIIVMPMIFTTAIGMSLVPAISESFALKKFKTARFNAKIAIKITLLLVMPCAFGLASLSSPIMGLLYAKEPADVLGRMLFGLAPGCIFLGLLYTFNGILQGMGKPWVPVGALLVGIIVKIIMTYVLTATPTYNILGSAFGTVSSYLIAAIIEYMYIKKSLKLKLDLMEFLIKPLITVILMFIVVKFTYGGINIFIGSKLATLVSIGVGGLVYLISILAIGGITEKEIKSMPRGHSIYAKLKALKLVK